MCIGLALVNIKVTMCENRTIHFNTAFVAGGTNHGVLTFGNSVTIGVWAVVLRDITIADDVAIGAAANKYVLEENIAGGAYRHEKSATIEAQAWTMSSKADEYDFE